MGSSLPRFGMAGSAFRGANDMLWQLESQGMDRQKFSEGMRRAVMDNDLRAREAAEINRAYDFQDEVRRRTAEQGVNGPATLPAPPMSAPGAPMPSVQDRALIAGDPTFVGTSGTPGAPPGTPQPNQGTGEAAPQTSGRMTNVETAGPPSQFRTQAEQGSPNGGQHAVEGTVRSAPGTGPEGPAGGPGTARDAVPMSARPSGSTLLPGPQIRRRYLETAMQVAAERGYGEKIAQAQEGLKALEEEGVKATIVAAMQGKSYADLMDTFNQYGKKRLVELYEVDPNTGMKKTGTGIYAGTYEDGTRFEKFDMKRMAVMYGLQKPPEVKQFDRDKDVYSVDGSGATLIRGAQTKEKWSASTNPNTGQTTLIEESTGRTRPLVEAPGAAGLPGALTKQEQAVADQIDRAVKADLGITDMNAVLSPEQSQRFSTVSRLARQIWLANRSAIHQDGSPAPSSMLFNQNPAVAAEFARRILAGELSVMSAKTPDGREINGFRDEKGNSYYLDFVPSRPSAPPAGGAPRSQPPAGAGGPSTGASPAPGNPPPAVALPGQSAGQVATAPGPRILPRNGAAPAAPPMQGPTGMPLVDTAAPVPPAGPVAAAAPVAEAPGAQAGNELTQVMAQMGEARKEWEALQKAKPNRNTPEFAAYAVKRDALRKRIDALMAKMSAITNQQVPVVANPGTPD